MITLIQILLFLAFVVFIYCRYGVLSSISASSYVLQGNQRYIFTGWLYGLGILTLFQPLGVWGGVMAMGLATAGITIEHKQGEDLEDEWHTVGTIIAITSGFIGLFVLHGIWTPAVVLAAGATGLCLFAENWIWWTECLAMIMMAIGLFLV